MKTLSALCLALVIALACSESAHLAHGMGWSQTHIFAGRNQGILWG